MEVSAKFLVQVGPDSKDQKRSRVLMGLGSNSNSSSRSAWLQLVRILREYHFRNQGREPFFSDQTKISKTTCGALDNGRVEIGEQCETTCIDGFEVIGPSSVTCNKFGEYDADLGRCQKESNKKCKEAEFSSNADFLTAPTCVGEKVLFTDEEMNFQNSGKNSRNLKIEFQNGACIAYRFQCQEDGKTRQLSCKRGGWTMNPKKLCVK